MSKLQNSDSWWLKEKPSQAALLWTSSAAFETGASLLFQMSAGVAVGWSNVLLSEEAVPQLSELFQNLDVSGIDVTALCTELLFGKIINHCSIAAFVKDCV